MEKLPGHQIFCIPLRKMVDGQYHDGGIFMTFIGFKGTLDSQVVNMNKEMNNRYIGA